MPAISFSGTTSRGPFWDLILKEEKKQTIREPRKRPLKGGDWVTLYWKQRSDKECLVEPMHLIAESRLIAVRRVSLWDMWEDEENAKKDGFGGLQEFRDWFGGENWVDYDRDEQMELTKDIPYDIITWGKLYAKGKIHLQNVRVHVSQIEKDTHSETRVQWGHAPSRLLTPAARARRKRQ